MIKKTVTAVIVFIMLGPWAAMALTDYSDRLNDREIRAAFRAGLISREDQVISRLKACFKHQNSKSLQDSEKGRGLTLLLKEAATYYDTFSAEGQEYVDRLLMRPISTSNDWPWDASVSFYLPGEVLSYDPPAGPYPHISGKYTFWYVVHDTPDAYGTIHTTTTDFLYAVVEAFETSYATEVADLGYTAPLLDTGLPDNGGDGTIDVYLMNCGAFNVYGYTAPVDVDGSSSWSSYMVVDNDFEEFYAPPLDSMKVTVAHEFHHAIQFAINVDADAWLMEATSTWMEAQVYPDIPDNLQYLNGSNGFFANTGVSIDNEDQWYSNWIILEYMKVKWGQDSVRGIWDYMVDQSNSALAVSNEISDHGSTVKTAFTEFALKNYNQDGFYPGAADYDEVAMANAPGQTLDYSGAISHLIATGNVYVPHMAAVYYSFKPGSAIGPGDDGTLLIQVEKEAGKLLNAAVSVRYYDDSVSEYPLTVDGSGRTYFSLDSFNQNTVSEVVVCLANYSTDSLSSWFRIGGGLGETLDPVVAPVVASDSGNGGCFIGSI